MKKSLMKNYIFVQCTFALLYSCKISKGVNNSGFGEDFGEMVNIQM